MTALKSRAVTGNPAVWLQAPAASRRGKRTGGRVPVQTLVFRKESGFSVGGGGGRLCPAGPRGEGAGAEWLGCVRGQGRAGGGQSIPEQEAGRAGTGAVVWGPLGRVDLNLEVPRCSVRDEERVWRSDDVDDYDDNEQQQRDAPWRLVEELQRRFHSLPRSLGGPACSLRGPSAALLPAKRAVRFPG